jgi:threonine 3-dehydrogenase
LSDALAALAEPLSDLDAGAARRRRRGGQRVLVMGPGTIGQGIAALARRGGAAQVVVSGFDDAARFDASAPHGLRRAGRRGQQSLAERLTSRTGGEPFDVVFEATGVPETISEALRCCAATASSW